MAVGRSPGVGQVERHSERVAASSIAALVALAAAGSIAWASFCFFLHQLWLAFVFGVFLLGVFALPASPSSTTRPLSLEYVGRIGR